MLSLLILLRLVFEFEVERVQVVGRENHLGMDLGLLVPWSVVMWLVFILVGFSGGQQGHQAVGLFFLLFVLVTVVGHFGGADELTRVFWSEVMGVFGLDCLERRDVHLLNVNEHHTSVMNWTTRFRWFWAITLLRKVFLIR